MLQLLNSDAKAGNKKLSLAKAISLVKTINSIVLPSGVTNHHLLPSNSVRKKPDL